MRSLPSGLPATEVIAPSQPLSTPSFPTRSFRSFPPHPHREIIANLAKAAGLASMIAAMRPDIDNVDEYVRNTTARAFSVVASALGIPALLPFLKAVCQSEHTRAGAASVFWVWRFGVARILTAAGKGSC